MHDELLYAERALRAGAHGYVTKLEGPQKLLEAMSRANDYPAWATPGGAANTESNLCFASSQTLASPSWCSCCCCGRGKNSRSDGNECLAMPLKRPFHLPWQRSVGDRVPSWVMPRTLNAACELGDFVGQPLVMT
jgi:hypothetical protein